MFYLPVRPILAKSNLVFANLLSLTAGSRIILHVGLCGSCIFLKCFKVCFYPYLCEFFVWWLGWILLNLLICQNQI